MKLPRPADFTVPDFARFDPASRWLAERSRRERLLLGVLAGVAVVTLLYMLVWQPLAAARARAVADLRSYTMLSARLRAAGPEVARIAATRRTSAATVITDSAARAGLTIRRLEPQGDRTQVTFEDVPFDKVVEWLAGLQRDAGLSVAVLRVDRRPAPGIVNVQATVKS